MRTWTCELVTAIGLVAIPNTAPAQTHAGEATGTEIHHVRSHHQALHTMITTASEQSLTFRRMVETIDASDGIVYVEPGECRHGVRACLVKVTSAGPNRFLFVKVDIVMAERRLMAATGHELRHAIEILGEPGVRNPGTMHSFYKYNRERGGFSSPFFETNAAIEAGDAVAEEIGRFQRGR